jgi:F0F1-type ATP synthase alpha subunit
MEKEDQEYEEEVGGCIRAVAGILRQMEVSENAVICALTNIIIKIAKSHNASEESLIALKKAIKGLVLSASGSFTWIRGSDEGA